MSHSSATRIAFMGMAALGALLCSACTNTVRDVSTAREGVARFHQQLDAENYAQIYDDATPDFRAAIKREEFVAFAGAIHRKLGTVKDATQTRFFVNWTTSGTRVVVEYATKFNGGDATERFTWKVEGTKAVLLGYNINSNTLIEK